VDVVRDVDAAGSDEPTLVVDGDARPIGWAHRDHPGQILPVGSTFVPESDTLRTALDSALTSPYGLGVAVAPGTGRFAGVAGAQQILAQVADSRTASAESIQVREARSEPEERPEPVEELEDETSASPAPSGEAQGGEQDEEADLRSEPVDGADGGADGVSARSAHIDDETELRPPPVEGPEEERTGSTRIGELQLSAEPVERSAMGSEPVEGPDAGDSTDSTRMEPDREQVR
jgi:osmoprotectant transport system ATP-binding protein